MHSNRSQGKAQNTKRLLIIHNDLGIIKGNEHIYVYFYRPIAIFCKLLPQKGEIYRHVHARGNDSSHVRNKISDIIVLVTASLVESYWQSGF